MPVPPFEPETHGPVRMVEQDRPDSQRHAFPLCVFTKNASARSKAAAARRAEKGRNRRRWDDPAVAEARGKGGAAAEKGYTGKAFKGKGKFNGKRAGKG